MKLYLIGSLRNPGVPSLAAYLREQGHDVFDDWYAAGPEADDHWQKYEKERGHTYAEALEGYAANHVFHYDRSHLDRCGMGVLLLPAGRSGHLELGYLIGQGKPTFILLDKEPERFDVMYRFATQVVTSREELVRCIEMERRTLSAGQRVDVPASFVKTMQHLSVPSVGTVIPSRTL